MKTDTDVIIREVTRYDGQNIWLEDGEVAFELGSYLGGGAAGVVYEALNLVTGENVAVKILNPIGFKLTPSGALQRYLVAVQGEALEVNSPQHSESAQRGHRRQQHPPIQLEQRHIWWLIHPSTREVIAAFLDPRFSKLREVPLTHCVQLWGWDADIKPAPKRQMPLIVTVRGVDVHVPLVPKKFIRFLKERRSIFREIASMSKIRGHRNCLKLDDVMELLNDSKSTIFLILELALGGELFDRIEIDRGTSEATARQYFSQLLEGLAHCHSQGVCHRDLKPENLLLADNEDNAALKIADFGLSALFRARELSQEEEDALRRASAGGLGVGGGGGAAATPKTTPTLVRLKSVVGSPHYVAPEILNSNSFGYEGAKADVWSAGVILYAMLAGNLPFGKEILTCPRFKKWKLWTEYVRRSKSREYIEKREYVKPEPYPSWFFPSHFSPAGVQILTALLEPNAELRLTVIEALQHEWVDPTGLNKKRFAVDHDLATRMTPSNARARAIEGGDESASGPATPAVILEELESLDSFKSSARSDPLTQDGSSVSQQSEMSDLLLDGESPDTVERDNVNVSSKGMAPHTPASQLSSLSAESTGSNSSGGRGGRGRAQQLAAAEHMPFNSPPLAPKSVREVAGIPSDDAADIQRVNSLDDFVLEDSAWAPAPNDSKPNTKQRSRQQAMPQSTLVAQSPVLSFMTADGAAQQPIDAAELKDLKKFLENSDDFFDPSLPVFQEIVQRSTRFATQVPAAEVRGWHLAFNICIHVALVHIRLGCHCCCRSSSVLLTSWLKTSIRWAHHIRTCARKCASTARRTGSK